MRNFNLRLGHMGRGVRRRGAPCAVQNGLCMWAPECMLGVSSSWLLLSLLSRKPTMPSPLPHCVHTPLHRAQSPPIHTAGTGAQDLQPEVRVHFFSPAGGQRNVFSLVSLLLEDLKAA